MVTGSYYPEISGGGGIQAQALLRALPKDNIYYVVTTCQDQCLPLQEDIEDVSIFRVPIKKDFCSGFFSFFIFIKIFMKLRKKIDIIHFHGFSKKAVIFIILAKLFRKKIILKISLIGDDDPFSVRRGISGKIIFYFYSFCDVYVGVSPALVDLLKKSPLRDKRLVLIPNGVDTQRFFPAQDNATKIKLREELLLPKEKVILLAVGIFALHKGIEVLVKAWEKIKGIYGGRVALLFIATSSVGRFKNDIRLIQWFKDRMISNNRNQEVILLEKTSQIEKYYRAADIFVFPSMREGLPNVLLEAISCGLPCIASNLEGVTDYIIKDRENGLLFEPGNVDELANRLDGVLKANDLVPALRKKARGVAVDRFSISLISREYARLYQELNG